MSAPTMNLNTDAADLLEAAALRIERYGHCKGAYYPQPSEDPFSASCCVTGAMRLSVGLDPYRVRLSTAHRREVLEQADELLRDYIEDRTGYADAVTWNDEGSTTRDDVVAALRGAAEQARAS